MARCFLINGGSGSSAALDFTALSNALTGGTLSGLSITPNEETETFNIEITGLPSITIDSEGYWNINGERGNNPTKAQGEAGFAPTVSIEDTEAGVNINIIDVNGEHSFSLRDGIDGISPLVNVTQAETGATITITDKEGTSTAEIANGVDGITPHIDETSKHWFVGETDTGIVAKGTVDVNADCAILYATFLADNWSDTAPYTQNVTVTNIDSTHVPIVDISYSEDSSLWENEEAAYAKLTKIDTADGYIIGTCRKEKPTSDFTIKLKIAGDITDLTFVTQEEFDVLYQMINSANSSLENTLNGGELNG